MELNNQLAKAPLFWHRLDALNVDLSHRCPLECHLCGRQRHFKNKGLTVPGQDLSISDFEKITNKFDKIAFVGQFSDPIHHPEFHKILEICLKKKIKIEVHTASSLKSTEFFVEAFKTNPHAKWVFGIDGLPHQSHIYRKNQDGEKLFNVMLEAKKYLKITPVWQFIIFRYNEDKIDEAMNIAKEKGLNFALINSARWESENDPLKPTVRR